MEEELQLKDNGEEHVKPVHENNELTCEYDTLAEQPKSSVLHDSHISTNIGSQKDNFEAEKCNKMQTQDLSDYSFDQLNTINQAEKDKECYANSGCTNSNFNEHGIDKVLSLSESSKHISIEDTSLKNASTLTFSPGLNREELLERYHKAIEQRKELKKINQQLQQKVIHHFRSKSSDIPREIIDKNVNDPKQRYESYMSNLVELRKKLQYEREIYNKQTQEFRSIHKNKEDEIQSEVAKFVKMKREIALKAVNTYTGKKLSKQEVEFYLKREEQSDQVLRKIQLKNFKIMRQLQKIEQQLKEKEELGEGIHLIDFEQLKIENQTYHEKIEERNEDLLKFQRKYTNNIQVLTHIKEKLHFVEVEKQKRAQTLKDLEIIVNEKRGYLVKLKTSHESLRSQTQRLQQKAGLLRHKILLRHYEETVNRREQLENEIEELKKQFESVNLSLNELQKSKKFNKNKELQQDVDHQLKSARYPTFGNHLKRNTQRKQVETQNFGFLQPYINQLSSSKPKYLSEMIQGSQSRICVKSATKEAGSKFLETNDTDQDKMATEIQSNVIPQTMTDYGFSEVEDNEINSVSGIQVDEEIANNLLSNKEVQSISGT